MTRRETAVMRALNDPKKPYLSASEEQVHAFVQAAEDNALDPPLTSGPHQDGWRDWAVLRLVDRIIEVEASYRKLQRYHRETMKHLNDT